MAQARVKAPAALDCSEEYDRLMQDEYDYEDYYETKCAKEEKPLTFDEWRERRKGGWWALQ